MPEGPSDDDFINAWRSADGLAERVAKLLHMPVRSVYRRRDRVEKKTGAHLPSAGAQGGKGRGDAGGPTIDYRQRIQVNGFTGTAVIFSDTHWWPDISETVAYKALLEVIREEKPKLIIANGDILDGARISRFGRSGWEDTPKLPAELEEVKTRMAEIRHCYRGAQLIRTIGNHDIRFDKWLSERASDFEGIGGFRLSDHLKEWPETWSVWINDHTVVKHRWHGGVHAAWNNVLKSGMTTVTGHTHMLEVKPFMDYRGRRYGVQSGTLAEPLWGPQFAYGEVNPNQGCSGFAVLRFRPDGGLLCPELCEVVEGVAYFNGQRVAGKRKVAA